MSNFKIITPPRIASNADNVFRSGTVIFGINKGEVGGGIIHV